MRILLTGASGFIGSNLGSALSVRHEVIALVRRRGSSNGWAAAELVQDLSVGLDRKLLPEKIDAVIHLAQSEHYRHFPEHADDVLAINVDATLRLLEYARSAGASTFVYTSTGGVYGTSYERFAESDPVDPLDFYLSSKYSAELLIANYGRFFRTVVLRPFFVYGPGQSSRMLVPRLIESVRTGTQVLIDGDPGIRVNPIFVTDAIRVFEPALTLPDSGLFNVAGDEVVTITDLVHTIGQVVGREPLIEHSSAQHEGDLVGDASRMREILGVTPRVSLRDGLRATAATFSRPVA